MKTTLATPVTFLGATELKPQTSKEWIELVRKSGLLRTEIIETWAAQLTGELRAGEVAKLMVAAGVLSDWQVELLMRGKWKGFLVDRYRLWNLIESDDSRGIQVYTAVDRESGADVMLEIVPPSVARTKADQLFYIVHLQDKV